MRARSSAVSIPVAILALAACGDQRTASPVSASDRTPIGAAAATPRGELLERVPVVAQRAADNTCDWGSIDLTKARQLAEKYSGGRPGTMMTLDRDETTCRGALVISLPEYEPLRTNPETVTVRPENLRPAQKNR